MLVKNSGCFKMDGTKRQKKGDILVTVDVFAGVARSEEMLHS